LVAYQTLKTKLRHLACNVRKRGVAAAGWNMLAGPVFVARVGSGTGIERLRAEEKEHTPTCLVCNAARVEPSVRKNPAEIAFHDPSNFNYFQRPNWRMN
jgi:hypothetical protein